MAKYFLLDSKIRIWVFLAINLMTIFVEILRHYMIKLFMDKTALSFQDVQNLELKKRITVLLKNYKYIPKMGFEMRKKFFHPESEFFKKRESSSSSGMNHHQRPLIIDPLLINNHEKIINMIKNHSCNHLPTILAGAWITYTFSGFICTKVPFPLALSFKNMLQQNIEIFSLDPSWVSSCSWYFLNVFGLRNFLRIFFQQHCSTDLAADFELDYFADEDDEVGAGFKEEFNNLELTFHETKLEM